MPLKDIYAITVTVNTPNNWGHEPEVVIYSDSLDDAFKEIKATYPDATSWLFAFCKIEEQTSAEG